MYPNAKPGGNVFVYYTSHFFSRLVHTLNFSRCEFAYGINTNTFNFQEWTNSYSKRKSEFISWGSGLKIIILEPNFVHVEIDISNCMFYGGKAVQGGGIFIGSRNSEGQISVRLSNSTFTNNSARNGGGLNIVVYTPWLKSTLLFKIGNCVFNGNKALHGAAVHIEGDDKLWVQVPTMSYIKVLQTTFLKNVAERSGGGIHIKGFMAVYDEFSLVMLSNSTFIRNNGSAVYTNASRLIISGVVKVINNHGVSGGGFYFDCTPQYSSSIYLTPHSQLFIANNTASQYGGAVAIKDCNALTLNEKECSIQILDKGKECSPWPNKTISDSEVFNDTKIIMENNKAKIAGDSVYGGSLETCYMQQAYSFQNV